MNQNVNQEKYAEDSSRHMIESCFVVGDKVTAREWTDKENIPMNYCVGHERVVGKIAIVTKISWVSHVIYVEDEPFPALCVKKGNWNGKET